MQFFRARFRVAEYRWTFHVLPNRRCALKNKSPLIFLALLALACALWAQKEQPPAKAAAPEFKIPPEDAAKVNPVKPTPESLAKGKKMYGYDCAMCHGKDGDRKAHMPPHYKHFTHFTNPHPFKNRPDPEPL